MDTKTLDFSILKGVNRFKSNLLAKSENQLYAQGKCCLETGSRLAYGQMSAVPHSSQLCTWCTNASQVNP